MEIEIKLPIKSRYRTPAEMNDGDIGVIVVWSLDKYIGEVVQKFKDNYLINIGKRSGLGWDDPQKLSDPKKYQVMLIADGDIIRFTEPNQKD